MENVNIDKLKQEVIELLKQLIAIPSLSGEENQTAELIAGFLEDHYANPMRKSNNIWAKNLHFDPQKPTILLNSHHDTVPANSDWKHDPFKAELIDGQLFGLGSNDAGAPLVSLLAAFLGLYDQKNMAYNLIFSATAEEENTGKKGIVAILDDIGPMDFAIVGEPTGMQLAVAEKGLIVLHCLAKGVPGHAARNLGENAILKAMADIQWLSQYQFPKISHSLGPVKMTVTKINGGIRHNMIPESCEFVVDVRTTDEYNHEEIIETVNSNISSEIYKFSNRLNPSSIPLDHPLVKTAQSMGIKTFGSPTLSDQARIPVPSVKIGPGRSERSHTADEFVYLSEIESGIDTYIKLLQQILVNCYE